MLAEFSINPMNTKHNEQGRHPGDRNAQDGDGAEISIGVLWVGALREFSTKC